VVELPARSVVQEATTEPQSNVMSTEDEEVRRALRYALVLLFELRLLGSIPNDRREAVDRFLEQHLKSGIVRPQPVGDE
jgi:hypothetical protein